MAHLAFAFCCVIWGSSFILLERVTHAFGPVEIGIWRMLSGAAAVALVSALCGRRLSISGRDWANIAIVAAVANAPLQVIQAYVLGHGLGHGFLGTTVAAIPLLTILLSIPMLGIVPTWRELTGVVGGLLCMGLILDAGVQRGAPWELLALTLLVPVSSAVSNTFVKWKLSHVSAGPLTAAVLATAGLTLIPLELYGPALSAFDLAAPASADVGGLDVIYLLLLGVIGSGISTMVFTWMILVRGPLFAGMTTYVVPVIALLWGQFDRETISTEQVAAIAGVLAMVALVQWRPRGRPAAALRPAVAEALAPPAPAALAVEASPPSSPVGGCSATDSLAT